MSIALSEPFGDYELVERLGTGGMADTFVALRRGAGGFEQRVCLKRILPAFAGDPEFVEIFLREARCLAASAFAQRGSTRGSCPTLHS